MNKTMRIRLLAIMMTLLLVSFASGCTSTQSKYKQSKGEQSAEAEVHHDLQDTDQNEDIEANNDSLETINRVSFNFNETLDAYLLKPIAERYAEYIPTIYRSGITNFFSNITYLNVTLNSFLQGKLKQGTSDTMRFLVNSTIGFAGLNDIATPMGLKKHHEDLGQTLAVWGVEQSAYLYVPLYGPNTIRNVPNIATKMLLNPLTYIGGVVLFPVSAINIVNTRANLLKLGNIRDEAAIEPYIFTREAYLQRRNNLIYDGEPPMEGYDDIFNDFGDDSYDNPKLSIE